MLFPRARPDLSVSLKFITFNVYTAHFRFVAKMVKDWALNVSLVPVASFPRPLGSSCVKIAGNVPIP